MTDEDPLERWARATDPSDDPITGDEVRTEASVGSLPAATPHRRRRQWLTAAAALLVLLGVGALALAVRDGGSTEVDTAGSDGAGLAMLDGVSMWGNRWRLVSVSTDEGSLEVPGAGTDAAPVLDLTVEGQASFRACNKGWAPAALRDGVFKTDGSWASQLAACEGPDGPREVLDEVIAELLEDGATIKMGGGVDLTLTSGSTVARFRLEETEPVLPTEPGSSETTTSTTPLGPTTTTSVAEATSTTVVGAPEGTSDLEGLTPGEEYYVDIDLQCEAFELSGTWVVVEGDVRSWQPPDQRHEGGMFTLDSPTTGTFRGDAGGTKVATFRLLTDSEAPTCEPIPR